VNQSVQHLDVAAYAMGSLREEERFAFEAHLEECDACRRELSELHPAVALLALADRDLPEAPPGLEARTILAVEHAASSTPAQPRRRLVRWTRRRWLVPALGAACLIVGVFAGLALRDADEGVRQRVEGAAELRAGSRVASVSVVKTGIGRVVDLRTDDLPILPKGEYYEIWFVGPGDRPGRPNRISAGTFHPDQNGRSAVTFAAAVDPRKYPRMAITAERGDGDPSPAPQDVLSGPIELR
jgi:hypothetical protein